MLKHITFASQVWTQLLSQLPRAVTAQQEKLPKLDASVVAANRSLFRASDRTLRLMQTAAEVLLLFDRPEDRIKLYKLQLRLHRSVIADADSEPEMIALYTEIAETYAALGFGQLAERYLEKARASFRSAFQSLKPQQKLSWLLSVARFSVDTDESQRVEALETTAAQIAQLTSQQKTLSSYCLLARAKSFHAHLLAGQGSIDEAVVLALDARKMRLQTLPRFAFIKTKQKTKQKN